MDQEAISGSYLSQVISINTKIVFCFFFNKIFIKVEFSDVGIYNPPPIPQNPPATAPHYPTVTPTDSMRKASDSLPSIPGSGKLQNAKMLIS